MTERDECHNPGLHASPESSLESSSVTSCDGVDASSPAQQVTVEHLPDQQSTVAVDGIAGIDPGLVTTVESSPTFRSFIPVPTTSTPRATSSEKEAVKRKRKVGHACILTASPNKRMLVEAKQHKLQTERKREERKRKSDEKKFEKEISKRFKAASIISEESTKPEKPKKKKQSENEETQHQQCSRTKTNRPTNKANATVSTTSEESNKPEKAKKSKKKQSENQKTKTKRSKTITTACNSPCVCYECGIVEYSEADVNLKDDWIKCCRCDTWCHESCGEKGGILDDFDFFCAKCAVAI